MNFWFTSIWQNLTSSHHKLTYNLHQTWNRIFGKLKPDLASTHKYLSNSCFNSLSKPHTVKPTNFPRCVVVLKKILFRFRHSRITPNFVILHSEHPNWIFCMFFSVLLGCQPWSQEERPHRGAKAGDQGSFRPFRYRRLWIHRCQGAEGRHARSRFRAEEGRN